MQVLMSMTEKYLASQSNSNIVKRHASILVAAFNSKLFSVRFGQTTESGGGVPGYLWGKMAAPILRGPDLQQVW